MDQKLVRFGKSIRTARTKKGISMRSMAKSVGASPTYISQIERGIAIRPPSEELVRAIAEALDKDPDWLVLDAGRIPAAAARSMLQHPWIADFVLRCSRMSLTQLDDMKSQVEAR